VSKTVPIDVLAGLGIVVLIIWAAPPTRRWLIKRLKTFDYLSDYIEAIYRSFLDIVWGEVVVGVIWAFPFLIWGLVTQFVSTPTWLNWIAIFAAFLVAGYYVWRVDHVRLERRIEIVQITPREWPVKQGEPHAY
jgi:hypothetical protein